MSQKFSKLRRTLRISRWEISSSLPPLTRKTIGITIVALVLLTTISIGAIAFGSSSSEEMYTVGVDSDSPYYDVAQEGEAFQTEEPSLNALREGEQDILVEDDNVYISGTERSNAAATEFRIDVRAHNDRMLNEAGGDDAAYPVSMTIRYVSTTDGVGDIDSDGIDIQEEEGGGVTSENNEQDDGGFVSTIQNELHEAFAFDGATTANTPGELQPPVPFQSLILSLFFLIPLNFVAQAYGSSLLRERVNNRGEMLLSSPATKWEIIAGKTLPYIIAITLISSFVSLLFGGGILAVLAIVPLGIALLAGVFTAAMYSRSFKELTFITTFLSVGAIVYAFVPAMFTDVHPISSISPLTIVVQSIEPATTVGLNEFVFSFTPLAVLAVAVYALGAGLYREEDLFAQRSISQKVLDSLSSFGDNYRLIPLSLTALMPIVFVTQLLLIAVLFAVPAPYNILALFVAISIIEELAKSLPIRAGMERGIFKSNIKTALICGVLSGFSFFILEKVAVFAQIVGMHQLEIGQAAFHGSFSALEVGAGSVGLLALFAPAVLHMFTTSIASIGASKTRSAYLIAFVIAVAVHTLYNLTVVITLG